MRSALGSWLVLVTLTVACAKEDIAPAPESSGAAKGSGKAELGSRNSYDEASFSLNLRSDGDYRVGKQGEAQVELVAKSPYKVNQEYPHKLKLEPSEAIEYAATTLGKDALELHEKRAFLRLKLTPKSTGKQKIQGRFSFSVCTAERCLVEKRDLTLEIHVK